MTSAEMVDAERVEVEPTPKKLGLLFPGQGLLPDEIFDYFERLVNVDEPLVNNRLEIAQDVSELPILGYLRGRNSHPFEKTAVMQPVVYALSVTAWELGRKQLNSVSFVAGHSLGEYSALTAAGVFPYKTCAGIVVERSKLMQRACENTLSGLSGFEGLDENSVRAVCRESATNIALFNGPSHIVIGGKNDNLEVAERLAIERGARRVRRLKTAGAFHTELMQEAARGLDSYLDGCEFREPEIPVVANLTGQPSRSAHALRNHLVESMVNPVRWRQSVEFMRDSGVEVFWEVGPGNSLSILNRINGIEREKTKPFLEFVDV